MDIDRIAPFVATDNRTAARVWDSLELLGILDRMEAEKRPCKITRSIFIKLLLEGRIGHMGKAVGIRSQNTNNGFVDANSVNFRHNRV